ncbi:MAG: ABC transporter permease [Chitinophagales bacterium]|nr:ABC transporter permease [Chitinophagaceae bacterium]MCB9065691.1 ABC transporter permease [Chitinophagales bacterium]
MKKILATIIKEWILTKRDIAGLMLLFIMPAILIVVMAMVQDAPFKDYQEKKFELLVADHDNGKLADAIISGLKESNNFIVVDVIDGIPLTEDKLKQLLHEGVYKVGIVIPKGATAEMVNAANLVANSISERLGMGTLPSREVRDTTYVRMYFDPASKPTFRMSVNFALDKYITFSSSKMLVERMSKLGGVQTDSTDSNKVVTSIPTENFERIFKGIGVRERMLNDNGKHEIHMSSVQHNVPAWAIFGMFFIVIPICGHLIRERDERSALRIELIPNARKYVSIGKILFYTIICSAQFAVMFGIGLWVLPLLGLPALHLGTNAWVLIPVAVTIAIAATSYGYFIGVIFKTTNQAMPFGAISIVILSAMGGVWVPIDIFSPAMQKLAMISPLYWGLDAVNHITLRNGNLHDVQYHILVLLSFSIVLWVISTYRNRTRFQNM